MQSGKTTVTILGREHALSRPLILAIGSIQSLIEERGESSEPSGAFGPSNKAPDKIGRLSLKKDHIRSDPGLKK